MDKKFEKIIFLIKLTLDNEFPIDDVNGCNAGFSEEDSRIEIIMRKKRENMPVRYILYTLEFDGNFIRITKQNEDNLFVEYVLEFKNIGDRHFADLFADSERTIRYEFNKDILNNDYSLDWKIIKKFEYDKVNKKSR